MLDFSLCAITNLFRIYLIYRFAEIFLGKSEKSKLTIFSVCASYYVANIALYWTFHTAWINLTCNLIGVSAIAFLFTKSIKTNLFVTLSVTLINIGCDILATLPYVNYEDGQSISQVYEILTDFYILICLFLIGKIITTHRNAERFFMMSLACVPVCSIALIMFLVYSNLCTGTGIAAVGIGLLIINFFMFYLYNPLLHNMSKQFETELLEQKVQIYSNQLSVIMQSEERTKALRHDMKHHINELMILANENNSAEIRQYLEKMQDFLKNPEEIVSSGNLEIDSVLNYMLQRAKEELNTVNAKVLLPENMKHSFDLNVLLGNLLENAIEAARQTDKKYLSVDISLKKGIIFIKVDNSYLPEENLPQNQSTIQPILAASSRKHLGLGLKNIKRIIDAHDGSMEIIKNDGIFSVKAMLYTAKMK